MFLARSPVNRPSAIDDDSFDFPDFAVHCLNKVICIKINIRSCAHMHTHARTHIREQTTYSWCRWRIKLVRGAFSHSRTRKRRVRLFYYLFDMRAPATTAALLHIFVHPGDTHNPCHNMKQVYSYWQYMRR